MRFLHPPLTLEFLTTHRTRFSGVGKISTTYAIVPFSPDLSVRNQISQKLSKRFFMYNLA